MRLSIRILVPDQCSQEQCEEFLKSPSKFMSKHGGEIHFLHESRGESGFYTHRVPGTSIISFAAPVDQRAERQT
jgi:hypothetical protein